jgi:hypothetical protein
MTDAISEPASSPTCEPLPGCRICAPNRRRHLDRGTVRDAELGHSPGRREDAGLEPPASLWAFAARSIPLPLLFWCSTDLAIQRQSSTPGARTRSARSDKVASRDVYCVVLADARL